LRIIGGKYKGRVIQVSRNFKARPTTDYARESLFNILNNLIDFSAVQVLDLFGGTGSIAFEFASRGCHSVDVVEINARTLRSLNEAAVLLGIKEIYTIRADVFRYIKSCAKKYDVIFADPPFALKELRNIPDTIFSTPLLETDGLLILEHPKEYDFSGHLHFNDHRRYGHVNFSFFKKGG
jgi:16S rRNA (guanine(966)-N(2))-methyltransferase RsmD